MSNKLNYERDLQTNRLISYGSKKIANRVARSNKNKPTYEQVKYYKFLRNLCIENGVETPGDKHVIHIYFVPKGQENDN